MWCRIVMICNKCIPSHQPKQYSLLQNRKKNNVGGKALRALFCNNVMQNIPISIPSPPIPLRKTEDWAIWCIALSPNTYRWRLYRRMDEDIVPENKRSNLRFIAVTSVLRHCCIFSFVTFQVPSKEGYNRWWYRLNGILACKENHQSPYILLPYWEGRWGISNCQTTTRSTWKASQLLHSKF